MVTDHRPVRAIMHLATTYKALKIHLSACTLQNLILLAYSFRADCAHLLRELFNFMKMRTFYKKLPLFIKYYIDHTYKKLKPQISLFIKNSIFGINRDPCPLQMQAQQPDFSLLSTFIPTPFLVRESDSPSPSGSQTFLSFPPGIPGLLAVC